MVYIKTYYLIDYENVHGEGLAGCQDLGKTDHIVIFFTQNAKSIDMSDIYDHGFAELEMIEVPAGKQSTDMHIGSYLGYLAGANGKNCKVVIVSKDTDYDKVIQFWKQKTGIAASRSQQIKKEAPPKPKVTKEQPASTPKATKKQPEQKAKVTKKQPEPTPKATKKQPASTPKASAKASQKTSAKASAKASTKVSGTRKTRLNQEVMQAVRGAGFKADVANTVAGIAAGAYGNERMLSEVHNALKKEYTNYLDVYEVIKPVLSKYTDTK